MPLKVSQDDFIAAWNRLGNPTAVAKETGLGIRTVQERRARLQAQGITLKTIATSPQYEAQVPPHIRGDGWTFPREKRMEIFTGCAVIFSDAHYWPGAATVAHRALIAVIRAIKPRAVFANGDILDGVKTSRHDPFGFGDRPGPVEEMDICKERMGEIEQAIPNGCRLEWNIGNHDVRWERTLVSKVPDFANLQGMRLADHFPAWDLQWSTLVNPDAKTPVMIKHRNAGGVHAGYNNTMKGGIHIVTGHTHILEVKPWGDYRGRRYGIQSGCLINLDGPQTEYTENGPSSACPGFVVLTFRDGELTPPELCEVINGKAWFRGEIIAS
jgi:hypothetical protein